MNIKLILVLTLYILTIINVSRAQNTRELNVACEQATSKFEKIELEKGHKSVKPGDFMELCDDVTKTSAYWNCMNDEADQQVELNVAHTKCNKI